MRPDLVDLSSSGFVLEPRYWCFGWSRSPRILLRRTVAAQLVRARGRLPAGWNLKLWDGWRSYATHVRMVESFRRRLRCANPGLPEAAREELLWRYAARVKRRVTRPDSHRTGGAVDLTLVDASGRELEMGTDHDALVPEAALAFYERKPRLAAREKAFRDRRRILAGAMAAAGFRRYAPEWWHWSSVRGA